MITNPFKTVLCLPVLFIFLFLTAPSVKAEQPISAAFGQPLGGIFDPSKATMMSQSESSLAFGFFPSVTLPVLSEFNVMVSPLTYRIYAILAKDELGDSAKCRSWANALFSEIAKKYAGEEYQADLYELQNSEGWKLKQKKNGRWITVKCSNGVELSIIYADDAIFELAKEEQHEWNQIYADYQLGQYDKILPRLRQLAEHENMQAQLLLGVMHRFGQGVDQSNATAEFYYKRAAQRGYGPATYNLGTFYMLQERYLEAEPLLKKAADSGAPKAQYNLGQLYLKSESLYSLAEAFRWFRKAAEQGHAEAQYNTCHMYSAGDGVERNDVMAYKWCHLAALQGHTVAQRNRDYIARRMDESDIARARAMAELWLSQRKRQ